MDDYLSYKEKFEVKASSCPKCGIGVSNHDQRFKIAHHMLGYGKYAHGGDTDPEGKPADVFACAEEDLLKSCACHDCQVLHGSKIDHTEALRALIQSHSGGANPLNQARVDGYVSTGNEDDD